MHPDLRSTCLAIIITIPGTGCEPNPAEVAPPAEPVAIRRFDPTSAAPVPKMTTTPSTDADAGLDAEADPDDPPMIDFPMLDEARRLDFIEAGLTFPESLKELDGRRVSLVGFMAPFDDLRNMRRCMILPSYVGCKFCSPPSVTQVVFVTQGREDDSGVHRFIDAPCHVTGTLRLSLPERTHEGQRQGFMYSLEDAAVTVHTEEAPERAPGHGNAPHQLRLPRLAPITSTDLIREVAEIVDLHPRRPIEIERVSAGDFEEIIRTDLELAYPEAHRDARSDAFRLLGLLPEKTDWIDTLAEFQLSRRVAATDDSGTRIRVLDSVPDDHPYVRLQRVGEIADALALQHFPRDGIGSSKDAPKAASDEDDDARRAHDGLRQGFRTMTIYRYARGAGIPGGARPPATFIQDSRDRRQGRNEIKGAIESAPFGLWESVPGIVGSFFVDARVGDAGPLAEADAALARPPSTTMELFRPRWYEDPARWRHDPVPAGFAEGLLDTRPVLTDVLGIGGLVPILSQWYSFEVAKRLAGGWAGDRWALWRLPDDGSALLLETRWQDEASAIQFHAAIPDNDSWFVPPHRPGSNRVRLLRADSPAVLDRLKATLPATWLDEADGDRPPGGSGVAP